MIHLRIAAGAARQYVTTQNSSQTSRTTTHTSHASIPNPMSPLIASTSYSRPSKDELQITAKEQELANMIHSTGTNLDYENMVNCQRITHLTDLKNENLQLRYQISLQRMQVSSLEDKIRQNDMEIQTMRIRVKELEDCSAELKRENSQLAQKNTDLTRALESAIISVTLEEHQAWVKIAALQEKRMQNEMELHSVLEKQKELEDNVAELRRENSRLVKENKDLKHWLLSESSTPKENEEKDEHLRQANHELKNKSQQLKQDCRNAGKHLVYIKLLDAILFCKPKKIIRKAEKSGKASRLYGAIRSYKRKILEKLRRMVDWRKGSKTGSSEKSATNSGSSKRRISVSVCPIDDEEDVDKNGRVAYSRSNSRVSSSSCAKLLVRDGKWTKGSAWLQTSFRSSFYIAVVIR